MMWGSDERMPRFRVSRGKALSLGYDTGAHSPGTEVGAEPALSVSSGCHNKMPWAAWLTQQTFIFS